MENSYIGELASLGAALIWAFSISMYRHFGRDVAPEIINLFKCMIAAVCLVLTAILLRMPFPDDAAIWLALATSGLIGLALGDTAFFTSLRFIGAQLSSALQTLSPAFTAIIAYLWLGETLTFGESVGICLTTAALVVAILFSQKRSSRTFVASRKTLMIGVATGVLSALLQAVGLVISRAAMQHVDVIYGSFMRMLPTVIVLAAWVFWHRDDPKIQWRNLPEGRHIRWPMLAIAAFSGSFLGIILGSAGAKYSKAAVSSVLTSTYPIWLIPIAWFWLDERSNWQTIVCIVIAVMGIGLMFL